MVRQYTRAAKRNLRAGAVKMAENISIAARVRRDFRRGRPPKGVEHLRPLVAVDKAEFSLADFRSRMRQAGTSWFRDEHIEAMLVTVDADDATLTPVGDRAKMLANLAQPGAYALGCLFAQFDADTSQNVFFCIPFIGLNPDERATTRDAAARWRAAVENSRLGLGLENMN
jgi:hypothetical protein